MTPRGLAVLVLAVALGGFAHSVGERARYSKLNSGSPDDLLYLPESRVLRAAALGYTNLFADFIWLRAIQYYGEHRLTDRNYPQAERLFHTIYDLDPAFKGATRFGALVLAQDARDSAGAITLLEGAERDNPTVWEYPFDQGFIHHTIERKLDRAAEDYKRAAAIPGAPDLALRLAGLVLSRTGDHEAARAVWTSILDDPPNEMMRRLAERGFKNVAMEETEEKLTECVATFRAKRGRTPNDWSELQAAGLLDVVPSEPYGGRYFLDPADGSVRATTTIDRDMSRQRDVVTSVAEAVKERDGAFPGSIEEMVKSGELKEAPSRPLGLALTYDPATGRVSWNPPWPPTEEGVRPGESPADSGGVS